MSSRSGLDRRELLRLGAAGVAGIGAGGLLSVSGSVAAREAQTPGSGQGQKPPVAPEPSEIVRPGALIEEDWSEPWVWRPSDWPDQPLALHVVANAHAPRATSSGNPFTPLFSFNGASPGPTIRMRGDETLKIKLRNLMGPTVSQVPIGYAPDPFEQAPAVQEAAFCGIAKHEGMPCTTAPPAPMQFRHFGDLLSQAPVRLIDAECLTQPANIPHGAHCTNLHTHGLHVEPGTNPNGTIGDNIFLRILPRADGETRKRSSDPSCRQLMADERVSEADFEHPLGDVERAHRARTNRPPQPHPPGTHWYHPHAHGATAAQVSSGMAGFLVVEGDVDEAINLAITGTAHPNPEAKTGPYDYRERLMMIQRVQVSSVDTDHGPGRGQGRLPPPTAVNGGFAPTVMFMRPGAIERWRVLNASVDGRGFKNFMVLKGQFVFDDRQLWRVTPGATEGAPPEIVAASLQDVEEAKRPIYQLAFDGITLVTVENGRARHTIKDLARQNAGSKNPLARPPAEGESQNRATLRNIEDCFRDGAGIRNLRLRPNQIFLANGNRTDVFFKAPLDAAGTVYTVFAQEAPLATDNIQQRLQQSAGRGPGFGPGNPAPVDVVVGYVRVVGDPVPGGDFDVMTLRDRLPDVPPYLRPVEDDELRVPAAEASRRNVPAGGFRSHVISYSGNGPTDFPVIEVPESFTLAHPDLKRLLWDEVGGQAILLPPFGMTMAIHPDFDLAARPDPGPPRKFEHHGDQHPKVLVDTAEEWVVYNCSAALWSRVTPEAAKEPGSYAAHYRSFPIGRAEGQAKCAKDPDFQITTKGADHPFHIHVNPCWVTRIDVPDEQGRMHNILDEPRWMDTVSIPRQGGRVVFRSRFADYVGKWVNHCHILNHEDFGMMQTVEAVARAEDANYRVRTAVASHGMASDAVDAIYPRPSLELMYRQNLTFVDPHPVVGYEYPGSGFVLKVPTLAD